MDIRISAGELAKHGGEQDCWIAVHGVVYDVSDFLRRHPGGKDVLLRFAGKDATPAFDGVHAKGMVNMLPADAKKGLLEGYVEPAPKKTRHGDWDDDEKPRTAVSEAEKPPIEHMINVRDFINLAKTSMDYPAWIYYQSAAEDERTLAENEGAFARIWFCPKVLVDVSTVDARTSVLGRASRFPLFVSASAVAGLAHPDGEVAIARAAAAAGIIQMVPTISSKPIEEIAAARVPGQTQFFQLYANRDRSVTRDLVAKAESLGFEAVFLTVDTPLIGRRERDIRNKYASGQGVIRSLGTISDPSLTWDYVDWLKSVTKMPVVLKGIQRADDALTAASHGVAGILLSNHGGRQLDGARASIDVLIDVRRQLDVAHPMEVYIDGGIRRGSDIVKAVALGAKAVGISRPLLYGLAAYGQKGAEAVLDILRDEFELCMTLNGARTVAEIGPDLVTRRAGDAFGPVL